jgi:hypothetical protein
MVRGWFSRFSHEKQERSIHGNHRFALLAIPNEHQPAFPIGGELWESAITGHATDERHCGFGRQALNRNRRFSL